MSTQTSTRIVHGIVAWKDTLNYFKTRGNVITIEYKHFEEMCRTTDANLNKILSGEYGLKIINQATDTKEVFTASILKPSAPNSTIETTLPNTTDLLRNLKVDTNKIRRILISDREIGGERYCLLILN